MTSFPAPLSDAEILAARPAKNTLNPLQPYAYLVEPECAADGTIVEVATVFLTNKECPFHCLMCDLWRNTLDDRVPSEAITTQIEFALNQLGPAQQIKLYNSGNFFDRQAIPHEEFPAIAKRVNEFQRVIVETHPRLCTPAACEFRDLLNGELEVALGLETVHPEVLARLNKQMTLDDFDNSVEWLLSEQIHVRAFLMLRPPYLSEEEGVEWAVKSLEHAFRRGVECCAIIPARSGNGAMEQLAVAGHFESPTLRSLEQVHEIGIGMQRGRVFVDLWDAERLTACPRCSAARRERLDQMNLAQTILPRIECECNEQST